jgi:hypothetical protein
MVMPIFARTPDEVSREAARLRRFRLAYEKLVELVPNDSPLGYEATGALAIIDWLLSEYAPALSDCLEDVLRYGLKELRRRPLDRPTGPVPH